MHAWFHVEGFLLALQIEVAGFWLFFFFCCFFILLVICVLFIGVSQKSLRAEFVLAGILLL